MKIKSSQFIKAVATLSFGTILAQSVSIVMSPLLTRLYTPEDFGIAAIFSAVLNAVAPAICGKYDVALVVAKRGTHAIQLIGISLYFTLGMFLLALGVFALFGQDVVELINAHSLGNWIYLVPFSIFVAGLLATLNAYANRFHDYKTISKSRILSSVFGVALSLLFGLISLPYGLLLSTIFVPLIVSFYFFIKYRKKISKNIFKPDVRKFVIACRYRAFPIYNSTTSMLDGITLAMPVFFLSTYYSESIVGYYGLMNRVAMLPIDFLSGAISQVNLKKVADLVNHKKPVWPYLKRLTIFLFLTVSPLMIVFMLYAPDIFEYIFGLQWRLAGEYLQILMPAIALKFVVSTISTTFGATGNNRLSALWKIIAFIVTLLVFLVVAPRATPSVMFTAILIMDLFLYAFYYILAWRSAVISVGIK